jgi:hypothetical protein
MLELFDAERGGLRLPADGFDLAGRNDNVEIQAYDGFDVCVDAKPANDAVFRAKPFQN